MIMIKCTSENCDYALTGEQIACLKEDRKKTPSKCPLCMAKLKSNITDPLARKRWYGYLSQDRLIIEHAVLVIIDEFNDGSIEVSIPVLSVQFRLKDKLHAIYKASEQIDGYLKSQYGNSYENERQFITIAFQVEMTTAKHNVPVGSMILQPSTHASSDHKK